MYPAYTFLSQALVACQININYDEKLCPLVYAKKDPTRVEAEISLLAEYFCHCFMFHFAVVTVSAVNKCCVMKTHLQNVKTVPASFQCRQTMTGETFHSPLHTKKSKVELMSWQESGWRVKGSMTKIYGRRGIGNRWTAQADSTFTMTWCHKSFFILLLNSKQHNQPIPRHSSLPKWKKI